MSTTPFLQKQFMQSLNDRRKELGLTTEELISRSGISRRSYFRKAKNESAFSLQDVEALARAVGTTPELLLKENAENATG